MSLVGSPKQHAGDNSSQLSAGRDIVYNQGITAQQMGEIMGQIATQVAAQISPYTNAALQAVETRLDVFQRRLFQRFDDERAADKRAFADPDFQMVVGGAAKSFARSGDQKLGTALIEMIANRSLLEKRSRELLALNMAIERVPLLTDNELAALGTSFTFRYSISPRVNSLESFADYLGPIVHEFLPDLVVDAGPYNHIAACGCGDLETGEIQFRDLIMGKYGGLFSKGFQRDDLAAYTQEGERHLLDAVPLCVCLNDPMKLQFPVVNRRVCVQQLTKCGFTEAASNNMTNFFESTFMPHGEFIEKMRIILPGSEALVGLWNSSPLRSLRLNATGLAIGHASYARHTGDETPLSIWIK